MSIDVFPQVVALLPLATYFLLLGILRSTRRPLVTTGSRDGAAVGIAVSGLVMIGPVHLLFPSEAAAELGWYIWIVLGVFYALCVSLALLSVRPRIVVYGMRSHEVMPHLLKVALTIDPAARLENKGQQVILPDRGVTLRAESLGITDAVQIESFERNLHPRFWRHLLLGVRSELATLRCGLSIGGLAMLVMGLFLMGVTISQALNQPQELLAGFREWMRV